MAKRVTAISNKKLTVIHPLLIIICLNLLIDCDLLLVGILDDDESLIKNRINITASGGLPGEIVAIDMNEAAAGTTVSINISGLCSGRMVSISSDEVTIDQTLFAEDGSASFIMPTSAVTIEVRCSIDQRLVDGGAFIMGSPSSESGRASNETLHAISVSSFYIGRHEISQLQWRQIMNSNPSHYNSTDSDLLPVENVNWHEAIHFCNAMSAHEGLRPVYYRDSAFTNLYTGSDALSQNDVYADWSADGYRLPSETEWEYAARGGSEAGAYNLYSGADTVDDVAWHSGNSSGSPHPIGEKNGNELDLYDMSGNLSEWCWDRYGSYPSDGEVDYRGPVSGNSRRIRGGNWFNDASHTRNAARSGFTPASKYPFIGLRLARKGS